MTSNWIAFPGRPAAESELETKAARSQSVDETAIAGRFTDSCSRRPDRHQSPPARVEIWMTRSVSDLISASDSTVWMNSPAGSSPRSECSQRARASTPITRPLRRSTFG